MRFDSTLLHVIIYHYLLVHVSSPLLSTTPPTTVPLSYQFVADPPTVAMQRLKGLTTGGLPTFVDISGSFGGANVDEDSWVEQLKKVPWNRRRNSSGGDHATTPQKRGLQKKSEEEQRRADNIQKEDETKPQLVGRLIPGMWHV